MKTDLVERVGEGSDVFVGSRNHGHAFQPLM